MQLVMQEHVNRLDTELGEGCGVQLHDLGPYES
jgi:hypothetical protein